MATRGESPERAGGLHRINGRRERHAADKRTGLGVGAKMFQHLAHGAKAGRAAVVSGRPGTARCQDARPGEVIRVDELIDVVTAAENRNVATLANPLEENLKTRGGRGP